MPFLSVTNSFVNGNTTVAADCNQNFNDCINSLIDSTKNMNIYSHTLEGYITVAGNVFTDNWSDYYVFTFYNGSFIPSSGRILFQRFGNLAIIIFSITGRTGGPTVLFKLPYFYGSETVWENVNFLGSSFADINHQDVTKMKLINFNYLQINNLNIAFNNGDIWTLSGELSYNIKVN